MPCSINNYYIRSASIFYHKNKNNKCAELQFTIVCNKNLYDLWWLPQTRLNQQLFRLFISIKFLLFKKTDIWRSILNIPSATSLILKIF